MQFWKRKAAKTPPKTQTAAIDQEHEGADLSKAEAEANAAALRARRQRQREEMLRRKAELQFPRTIEDFHDAATGEKYAVDAMPDGYVTRNRIALDNEVLDRLQDYFIGWQSCAILKQNWLIDRACEIPADDAVAPGYEVAYSESPGDNEAIFAQEQEKQIEILRQIETSAADFGILEICRRAEICKKTFGQALVVPRLSGVDMSKPFNIDAVRKGAYKGLAVVEPMWFVPEFSLQGIVDPVSPDFQNPAWYSFGGNRAVKVHRSWVIKLVNSQVPNILKPVYYYGGVPLTQQIFRRVYAAERTAHEAPNLAMSKRMLCVEGSLENAIANPDLAAERMSALQEWRDNYGVMLVENGSNARLLETTLTDFDQLIATQYQLVASIAQVPVTKLLKVQIRGFDSSGEYERDDYNKALVAIQENDYTPIIQLHNVLWAKSQFGESVSLAVNWNPVELSTPKEQAEIRMIDAQRDTALVNAGIVSAEEARQRLRNDENSQYTELADIDDDEFAFGDDPEPEAENETDETKINNAGAE